MHKRYRFIAPYRYTILPCEQILKLSFYTFLLLPALNIYAWDIEIEKLKQEISRHPEVDTFGVNRLVEAHEIQNPLNFVNNFSEVNRELADELKGELANGNQQSAIEIANDIKDNSEKINHHGKRADAIVKGMLQHSRSGTGQKEKTDINTLTEEYLKIAYHGMLAKDNNSSTVPISIGMKTDFDPSLPAILLVQQDMGRVLMNILSNAFYATVQKQKHITSGEDYKPFVTVQTKKINHQVEITVRDNGNGIPPAFIGKIFQPFFTTKPTGYRSWFVFSI